MGACSFIGNFSTPQRRVDKLPMNEKVSLCLAPNIPAIVKCHKCHNIIVTVDNCWYITDIMTRSVAAKANVYCIYSTSSCMARFTLHCVKLTVLCFLASWEVAQREAVLVVRL